MATFSHEKYDSAELLRLRSAAALQEAPDLIITGARVLNIFSGALELLDIGVTSGRIAWTLPTGEAPSPIYATTQHDLGGNIAVPGLVEPHAHPELLYGPIALSSAAVQHGTTTLCADLLTFTALLDDADLLRLLEACEGGAARMMWALRASAEGGGHLVEKLSASRLINLINRLPSIGTIGEMTAWRELANGDARLCELTNFALSRSKRINGHLPGASVRSLQRAAVAGITDDHEATTAEEAISRLDNGYWVMARHSTLRPDARSIVEGLMRQGRSLNRVMLTTDGPVAEDLVTGHLDRVIREVISGGVDPVEAIRMATINPATYLGMDHQIGALAPGRYADIAVISDLSDFRVKSTLVGGLIPTQSTSYPHGLTANRMHEAEITGTSLREIASNAPAVKLEGVLTRLQDDAGAHPALAVLVSKDGSWLTAMSIANLELDALASSYSGTGDIILIGQDFDLLADCYHRLAQMGSGIITPRRTLTLDLLDTLSSLPVGELAAIVAEIAVDIRMPGGRLPLEFLILFLGLGVLPELRLTPGGVLEVKTGKILADPISIRRRKDGNL